MAKRKKKGWKPKTAKETLSFFVSLFVVGLCAVSFLITYQQEYGKLPTFQELMGYFDLSHQAVSELPPDILENGTSVHFIDVGQADATLILSNGQSCLIDAGDLDSADELLGYLDAVGLETLDYLVMTHPHADHIGSMDDVLENYTVKQVILPDLSLAPAPTSKIFQKVAGLIAQQQIPTATAKAGDSYPLGNGNLEILTAGVKTDNYNNVSPVIKFSGEFSVLMTGDAEKEVEQNAIQQAVNLKADVFQAGHHGSSTSNTADFLQKVRPQLTVISCGKNNSYGHPNADAVKHIESVGSAVYRTDKQGSIAIYRDKNGLNVWTEKAA